MSRVLLCVLLSLLWACGQQQTEPEVVSSAALFRETSHESVEESVDQRIELPTISVFRDTQTALVARPPQSLYDADTLVRGVHVNLESVRDCFLANSVERSLEVVLQLELNESGKVLGGSSIPNAGLEGLSALAACILPKAKTWVFATRSTPGRTVLVVSLSFVVPD